MKKICLILLFFLHYGECVSQKLVHGLFEIRFLKEDDGSLCDYGWINFCYEMSYGVDRDSLINSIKNNESYGENVVFLINEEKPIGYEITDSVMHIKKLPPICNCYEKSNPRYVYVLYEIEGYACDIKLSTSKMLYNEEVMHVAHYGVDRTKQSFVAYYFYNLYFAECVNE